MDSEEKIVLSLVAGMIFIFFVVLVIYPLTINLRPTQIERIRSLEERVQKLEARP